MATLHHKWRVPNSDSSLILCDDGNDDPRRNFDALLGKESYDGATWGTSRLMRPEFTAEGFMQHVVNDTPDGTWVELAPRVWLWKGGV